ncbi:MAG: hypothetical protein ACREB8_14300 [Pseudolabrys sp.]
MNLKPIVVFAAVAAMPVCALAQNDAAAKASRADAENVVKIVSADKAKTQTYCEMVKLGDQIDEADQKKDSKTIDELSNKIDALSDKMGPEYIALMDGLQDMDANSKEGRDIAQTLSALDGLCPK